MSGLDAGLELTGTPFVTLLSGSAIWGFMRKQKKDQQVARDVPVHREMKFVSDEGTTPTQNPDTH